MINPINRTKDEKQTNIYKVEPYVIAADIYSSPSFTGRGGWTWYTGSAGWFYHVGIEAIIGLHKNGDKLKLDPKLPVSWDGYRVNYRYMDTNYAIEVVKGKKEELKVDGKVQTTDTITLKNDKKEHDILLMVK